MPVRICTIVDLPAPFSPMSAITSPANACRRMSVKARTPPKRLSIWPSVRIGSTAPALEVCTSEYLREFFYIAGVVREGRRHRRFAVGFHRHLAHATGGDLLAFFAGGLAFHRGVAEIDSGVAEV